MERVERIKDLNVRGFCAQGIVGADAIHPHLHCVVPAGGLSPDHQRWIHPRYPFFLPVKVLSRVFRGKFVDGLETRFCRGRTQFPRPACKCSPSVRLSSLPPAAVSSGLGGLCQAAIRRARARAALSGPLHSPRRDFQSPDRELCRRQSHFPLEGLCAQEQTTSDDRDCRRVPSAVPAPHSAARLCPHPLLRLPRQPAPPEPAAGLQATSRSRSATAKCHGAGS